MVKISWGNKITDTELRSVISCVEALGWDKSFTSYLMSCMAFESGLKPSAKNAASNASGLIQFMPKTLVSLGFTVKNRPGTPEEFRESSFSYQMQYVEKYFQPYKKRVKSLDDMYLAILYPAFIGKADDAVLSTKPQVIYMQNAGLDTDKDGCIQKKEICAIIWKKYWQGMQSGYVKEI